MWERINAKIDTNLYIYTCRIRDLQFLVTFITLRPVNTGWNTVKIILKTDHKNTE